MQSEVGSDHCGVLELIGVLRVSRQPMQQDTLKVAEMCLLEVALVWETAEPDSPGCWSVEQRGCVLIRSQHVKEGREAGGGLGDHRGRVFRCRSGNSYFRPIPRP